MTSGTGIASAPALTLSCTVEPSSTFWPRSGSWSKTMPSSWSSFASWVISTSKPSVVEDAAAASSTGSPTTFGHLDLVGGRVVLAGELLGQQVEHPGQQRRAA